MTRSSEMSSRRDRKDLVEAGGEEEQLDNSSEAVDVAETQLPIFNSLISLSSFTPSSSQTKDPKTQSDGVKPPSKPITAGH